MLEWDVFTFWFLIAAVVTVSSFVGCSAAIYVTLLIEAKSIQAEKRNSRRRRRESVETKVISWQNTPINH